METAPVCGWPSLVQIVVFWSRGNSSTAGNAAASSLVVGRRIRAHASVAAFPHARPMFDHQGLPAE